MIFYIFILFILIFLSLGRESKLKSFFALLTLGLMISLKGDVGPDNYGYLVRYENFDPINSFLMLKGELGWYLIEYITYINNWGYQMYTIFTALIGVGFLALAQNKIKYLGFLVFVFQLLFVQLGLSGMRQFIATSILVYAISIYLFENQKSIIKFIFLLLLAASFHISVLTMFFVLLFLKKLNTNQIILIILLGIVGLTSEIFSENIIKYDVRYLQGTRSSSGAWIRFAITALVIKFSLIKSNKNLYYLGVSMLIFGLVLGVINSIALHRFNFYFFPIACLLVIKNYKLSLIRHTKIKYVYLLSVLYFLGWFNFSRYGDSFIPYTFFFN